MFFFGLGVSAVIGVSVTFLTQAQPLEKIKGLVWGTIPDAIYFYKGSAGAEKESEWADANSFQCSEDRFDEKTGLPYVVISRSLADVLEAKEGELVYISDPRWWLGGLRSGHGMVSGINENLEGSQIELSPYLSEVITRPSRAQVRVKKLYGVWFSNLQPPAQALTKTPH